MVADIDLTDQCFVCRVTVYEVVFTINNRHLSPDKAMTCQVLDTPVRPGPLLLANELAAH